MRFEGGISIVFGLASTISWDCENRAMFGCDSIRMTRMGRERA